MATPVIDVSQYQGNIDWDKVYASGIRHAYIRLCNGTTLDIWATRNARECTRLGISFGFYCYWHPMLLAFRQADLLVKYTRSEKANLVPMVDVEAHDNQKPITIINKLSKTVEILTRAFGKPPTIYTGAWFWNSRVKSAKFSHCPLWVAKYVHYSLQAFHDPNHVVPVDPQDWDTYAKSHTEPVPVIGWSVWSAWQFAGGFDSVGERYGMQSRDLDLNILKDNEYSRFLLP
jgi:GH25 family lysozyme M1 (1,4-beta-N-acetylmuramidase)